MGTFPSNIQHLEVFPPFGIVLPKQIPSSFNKKTSIPIMGRNKKPQQYWSLYFLTENHSKKPMAELVMHGCHQVSASASYVRDSFCLFMEIIMIPLDRTRMHLKHYKHIVSLSTHFIWHYGSQDACYAQDFRVELLCIWSEFSFLLVDFFTPLDYCAFVLAATKLNENKLVLSLKNALEMSSILPI